MSDVGIAMFVLKMGILLRQPASYAQIKVELTKRQIRESGPMGYVQLGFLKFIPSMKRILFSTSPDWIRSDLSYVVRYVQKQERVFSAAMEDVQRQHIPGVLCSIRMDLLIVL